MQSGPRPTPRVEWWFLVYAAPLALSWLRAAPMVAGPKELFTLIAGPVYLIPEFKFVPVVALVLLPAFAWRQNVATGVLSALATLAWGFMGLMAVAVPHA